MNPFFLNYNMEEGSSVFPNISTNTATNITQDTVKTDEENKFTSSNKQLLSPTAPSFSNTPGSNLFGVSSQQETMASDAASSNIDVDEILYKIRMNNSDPQVDKEQNANYLYGNSSQAESVSSQIWNDNATNAGKSNEMTDTFDFLMKSLSSANSYVSMLTREQLSVLRSIRPGLLYEFLLEVARVRSDRRMRRALPHECAFCKNNGENEDCYSSHALKDFRGRVLCPVLRAFSCPRCGATGDRAHTIKYCPETFETVSERPGSISSRRRSYPPSALVVGASTSRTNFGSVAPNTPVSSPTPSYSQSCWATFTLNSSM